MKYQTKEAFAAREKARSNLAKYLEEKHQERQREKPSQYNEVEVDISNGFWPLATIIRSGQPALVLKTPQGPCVLLIDSATVSAIDGVIAAFGKVEVQGGGNEADEA